MNTTGALVSLKGKLTYVKDQLCSSCEMSKAKRSSFKSKAVPSSKGRLNLLHMDLCGPMRVASINGKKYILVIVDDYSRYTWTLFLRSKDETPEVLKDFLTMIQRNLQAQVISVRTDRGTEFLNKTLHAYFKEEGIEHQTSTPRTPEQNGVVERRNRTLVEAARTMLSASKLPLSFWAEAVATACYTQNRSIIITTHGKMAYHIINDRKPSIKHLHIFGCICYITRDGENLDKMKEKGDPCVMVGYSTQSKGYRVYNKRTRLIVESIHINPLLEEYYNPAHGHAEDNNNDQAPNASFQEDEFINPFCSQAVIKSPTQYHCDICKNIQSVTLLYHNDEMGIPSRCLLSNSTMCEALNRFLQFDTAVDRSFVSTAFSSQMDITPSTLDLYYDVELADRRIIRLNTILRGCTLNLLNHPFNINLMPIELGSFDAIIGMDWLAKYQAIIMCAEKIVCIPWGNETLIVHGDGSNQGHEARLHIISYSKTQEYMLKGCLVFLAHVTTNEVEDKSEKKRLEDVPCAPDFIKYFPEDLPGLPLRQFLGHVIDSEGIHVDPAKIESIKDWTSPKSPTKICQFLGLAGYYEEFIGRVLKIANQLTKLTQKIGLEDKNQGTSRTKMLEASLLENAKDREKVRKEKFGTGVRMELLCSHKGQELVYMFWRLRTVVYARVPKVKILYSSGSDKMYQDTDEAILVGPNMIS
ncbi:retrovirus-related pol polyprotein from transposon TNT 1-94 [Tanacetum coccineum]